VPPRAGRDVERNAIDVDFPCALVRKLLDALPLPLPLGLANALPREDVVPKVRRANAEDSLMVLQYFY